MEMDRTTRAFVAVVFSVVVFDVLVSRLFCVVEDARRLLNFRVTYAFTSPKYGQ